MTGSYCKSGVSGFSLRGVYKAPIGTTSREASFEFFSANQGLEGQDSSTIRELGKVFQLSLIPSRSSTSLHESLRASYSICTAQALSRIHACVDRAGA